TLFPYTTLFRSAKGTTRVSARSCGAVRFGRPPTSQAVAAVHPSRSSASTSNSSRRHTDRPKDAYGVPAILPRPEGRGLPRTGSIQQAVEPFDRLGPGIAGISRVVAGAVVGVESMAGIRIDLDARSTSRFGTLRQRSLHAMHVFQRYAGVLSAIKPQHG